MENETPTNGNGHNPRLAGWFMPEPLDTRVLERVLMLRAWRERNAVIGAPIETSAAAEDSRGMSR